MEVRFVTAASRGFFFLSRQDHEIAACRSFATEKKSSGTQGRLTLTHTQFKFNAPQDGIQNIPSFGGSKILVAGRWSLVAGHWSLATGH